VATADEAHKAAHDQKRAHAFITLHRADNVTEAQAQKAIGSVKSLFDPGAKDVSIEMASPLGPLHLWFVVQGGPNSENSDNVTHAETHNHLDRIAARAMSLVTLNPGEPVFKFERHH